MISTSTGAAASAASHGHGRPASHWPRCVRTSRNTAGGEGRRPVRRRLGSLGPGAPLTDRGRAQAIVQDDRYFAEQVEPHIDGDRVTYLGPVGSADRAEVLGSAAALLHPISFAEPFGLSVVEAMACGTPVVAFRRGSMSEVVDDGVTGFLVSDVVQAVTAVDRAAALDRAAVRARALARFGVDRMVEEYLSVYTRLLTN
jgi:glycosyltransferase involved in cell wall biosynthesis